MGTRYLRSSEQFLAPRVRGIVGVGRNEIQRVER